MYAPLVSHAFTPNVNLSLNTMESLQAAETDRPLPTAGDVGLGTNIPARPRRSARSGNRTVLGSVNSTCGVDTRSMTGSSG